MVGLEELVGGSWVPDVVATEVDAAAEVDAAEEVDAVTEVVPTLEVVPTWKLFRYRMLFHLARGDNQVATPISRRNPN